MQSTFLGKFTRISTVLALVVLMSACATNPPRTSAELETDKKLELAVTQKLADDPNVFAPHIQVSANRGVVTLSGMVFDGNEIYEAGRVAQLVPGVASVRNQIEMHISGRGGNSL
ncbi:MAG: BON domain-containing protein [Burkholderiales bacterium]